MNGMMRVAIALLLISQPLKVICQTYSITTVGGIGPVTFSGDGGPALSARFDGLLSLAVDPAGSLYLADSQNQRIRKINTQGIVQTIAGTGKSGRGGDGTLALSIDFRTPSGVRVDNQGNVYVADTYNSTVRRVTPSGKISTILGRDSTATAADGEVFAQGGVYFPDHMANDSQGNLFVLDWRRRRILKITPDQKISVAFKAPPKPEEEMSDDDTEDDRVTGFTMKALAVDSHSRIFVIDMSKDQVFRIDTGKLQLVAGNGAFRKFDGVETDATKVPFMHATELGFDGDDNLYILDGDHADVRKVGPSGSISTVICKRKIGPSISFTKNCSVEPTRDVAGDLIAMAVDHSGNLYLSDYENQVTRVSRDGSVSVVAGIDPEFTGDGGPAVLADLQPHAVTIDKQGNLYVADRRYPGESDFERCRIRKISPDGIINTFAGKGDCKFGGDGGQAQRAQLSDPGPMAFDPQGNLYFVDDGRIRRISPAGIITTVLGDMEANPADKSSLSKLAKAAGIAVDTQGFLYIADQEKHQILRVSPDHAITRFAGTGVKGFGGDGGPATAAKLNEPGAVAVDEKGNVYLCDSGNHAIRKVSPDGIISSLTASQIGAFAGDNGPAKFARLNGPQAIAVDTSGNLYIADLENARIRKISASDQTITTIAGNGDQGFAGDGGLATDASLASPIDVVVDQTGNVYVVDSVNLRVRKLTPLKTPAK